MHLRTATVALLLAASSGIGLAALTTKAAEPCDEYSTASDRLSCTLGYQLDQPVAPSFVPPPVVAVGTVDEFSPKEETKLNNASGDCTLPEAAISATDSIENFPNRSGRFSKVPKYLVPFYEQACRDYGLPVKYLAADGSWETHFTSKLGDGGRSCGIHQFHANSRRVPWPQNWGFRDVDDCLNPEANIRKVAEFWSKVLATTCHGDVRCAIQRHNSNARGYAANVMRGADTYYAG